MESTPAMSTRAYFELLRWLGPWASPDNAPSRVVRRQIEVPASVDRPAFPAWVYAPKGRPPVGSYLVAPGLHYLGPEDPRMDRFLRVLAGAGLLVVAPFLPDFLALRVRETAAVDLKRAFDVTEALDERPRGTKPGVFSISFGSLPALRLAADEGYRERVGALVLFGGYADFREVIRFCLGGADHEGPRDPLNQPVVLMNLLDDIEAPCETGPVVDAWSRYVRATWGRPEMKAPERWQEVARALLPQLSDDAQRAFFELGVGLRSGALELCLDALDCSSERRAFLDPRPHLDGLRCPVHIFHGADDDVIPWTQMRALDDALPSHVERRRYLTGLYAHTGKSGIAARLGSAPALVKEAGTLIAMLAALVEASRRR